MRKKMLLLAALSLLGGTYVHAQSSPNTISGLKLWLDAADVNNGAAAPANNSVVSTWKDKSGNGNNATVHAGQSGGTYRTSQINGQPVVTFTRASQTAGSVYDVAGVDIRATTLPAITIFTVYRQGAQSGDQGLWGDDNGNWDRFYFTSWTSNGSPDNGGASLGPQATPAAAVPGAGIVGTTRLMTAVYNSGVASGSAIYFNGAKVTTFTDQTDLTAAQTSLRIGWDGDDNAYNGDIAEMIVYNRKLTDCEIQQVNRYLGGKYGIVFSTSSITTSDPTTFYEGGRATLTANPIGTSYQWLKNGTPISGATSGTYTAYTAGNYQVAITNSCTDTSAATAITVNTMTPPGNALNFDGTNDYVDLGTPAALAATNIKSMEAWVRFNSLPANTMQEILSRSIVGQGIEMLVYNNALAFFCMNSSGVGSYVNYPISNFITGRWYHVAATWDGTTAASMKLYVNGVSVGGAPVTTGGTLAGVNNPAGSTFKIGQWSDPGTTRYFNGSIDEVRIWSTTRLASDITANMYAPLTLPATGLIAYYKFDQGTANGSNASSSYTYDYSGNGNLGTLTNFALSGTTSNWVESYAMVHPTIVSASNVHGNSFVANWTAPVTGTVTNYLLDVATDNTFASPLSGYNGKDVGTATSATVTGLTLGLTYYYRVRPSKTSVANQAGPSDFSSIITSGPALAVSLVSFTATQYHQQVDLAWATATEELSDYFGVERSTDGVNYTEIGKVKAAGNSSTYRHYTFTDASPATGTDFYRLKQADQDGTIHYSPVRQIVYTDGRNNGLYVYPSPAGNVVTVETGTAYTGTTASVTDISGRELYRFTITNTKQQVDIHQLATGIYLVKLADGNTYRIEKN